MKIGSAHFFMELKFLGLSLFPNIKLAHLELTSTTPQQGKEKGSESKDIFLIRDDAHFILASAHGDSDMILQTFSRDQVAIVEDFAIRLPLQLLDGQFHKLGQMRNIYSSTFAITVVFALDMFCLAFPNESEYMIFDPIPRFFFCRWCAVQLSNAPLTIKEMPSDGWKNLVEYWTCHSDVVPIAAASASNFPTCGKGIVLASRFFYTFFDGDIDTPCCHLIENGQLAKFDAIPALSPHSFKSDLLDHKASIDDVLSSIIMDIIFYESVYGFKITSVMGSCIAFQVLNGNMFKIIANPDNASLFSYLEVISIELRENMETSSKGHIAVSTETFRSIEKIFATRNYLIKRISNFYFSAMDPNETSNAEVKAWILQRSQQEQVHIVIAHHMYRLD